MKVTKTERLYLKEEIAAGEHQALGKFTLYRALPTSHLLMCVEGGKKKGWYSLSLHDVADNMFDAIEKDAFGIEERSKARV